MVAAWLSFLVAGWLRADGRETGGKPAEKAAPVRAFLRFFDATIPPSLDDDDDDDDGCDEPSLYLGHQHQQQEQH